jgi:hypothetical protein
MKTLNSVTRITSSKESLMFTLPQVGGLELEEFVNEGGLHSAPENRRRLHRTTEPSLMQSRNGGS